MARFKFRGGSQGLEIVQYSDQNEEVSSICVPDNQVRVLGENLIEFADANDAIFSVFQFSLEGSAND